MSMKLSDSTERNLLRLTLYKREFPILIESRPSEVYKLPCINEKRLQMKTIIVKFGFDCSCA